MMMILSTTVINNNNNNNTNNNKYRKKCCDKNLICTRLRILLLLSSRIIVTVVSGILLVLSSSSLLFVLPSVVHVNGWVVVQHHQKQQQQQYYRRIPPTTTTTTTTINSFLLLVSTKLSSTTLSSVVQKKSNYSNNNNYLLTMRRTRIVRNGSQMLVKPTSSLLLSSSSSSLVLSSSSSSSSLLSLSGIYNSKRCICTTTSSWQQNLYTKQQQQQQQQQQRSQFRCNKDTTKLYSSQSSSSSSSSSSRSRSSSSSSSSTIPETEQQHHLATTLNSLDSNNNNNNYNNSNDDDDGDDNEITNEPQLRKPSKKFINFPFQYHEEIIVRIDSLTNRGYGIARVTIPSPTRRTNDNTNTNNNKEQPNDELNSETNTRGEMKWVVMIPNVIPGELVKVRVYRNYNNYSEADCIEIIEASEHRIKPVCSYYMICGGCQFQHMTMPYQRYWKTKHVVEAIEQYNELDTHIQQNNVPVQDCIGTNEIYKYRSKITPHYQVTKLSSNHQSDPIQRSSTTTPTTPTTNNNPKDSTNKKKQPKYSIQEIGFQKLTSRSLVDIESCVIATDLVNAKYQQVRQELLSNPTNRTKGATLLFRQNNNIDNDRSDIVVVSTDPKEYITTTINNIKFTYQAGNFFQNNYYVVPLMVEHVVRECLKPVAVGGEQQQQSQPNTNKKLTHLVDCYCGSGLFALSAAQYFDTVIGIEINDKAVQEANNNAITNNITNCQFIASIASDIFGTIQDYPRDQTVVIIDPPRKGCSEEFLHQLQLFQPQRIVYMSCDPVTQARDANTIIGWNNNYRVTFIQPFDLFPQTRHIESLMIFEKNT